MSVILPELKTLIHGFTARLTAAVEAQTSRRIQGIVSAALAGSDMPTMPSRRGPAGPTKSGAAINPSARKMSDKVLAARKLQGKYIGALRRLRPGARNRVKKVAREEGVAAAVRLAQSLT
jgi:hypothetical protein